VSETMQAMEDAQRAIQNLLLVVARDCARRGNYDAEIRQACAARVALLAILDAPPEVIRAGSRHRHEQQAALRLVERAVG
jgi:hypothetical protein